MKTFVEGFKTLPGKRSIYAGRLIPREGGRLLAKSRLSGEYEFLAGGERHGSLLVLRFVEKWTSRT